MKKYLKSQVGAASILFTMVMVVIISLLAIGFSVITTNDQKATIDKTISAQAKYAAQSGINSIVEAISNGKITQGQTQSTCSTDTTLIPDLGNIGSAKITCLKWNYKPQSLNYAVSAFTSKIQPDASIDSLTISWDISGSPKALHSGTPSNLTSLNSNNFPVVKIVTANNNTTNQFVTYVFPSSLAPSSIVTYPSNPDMMAGPAVIQIVSTKCSASPATSCSVTIKNFGDWLNTSPGLISVSTVVGSVASFKVTGSSGGASVSFSNSQVQIDSTATSQNQVQRLIASYSISGTNGWKPLFVAQSGSAMCKNYKYIGAATDGGQGPASPSCSN
jgi:hypothetical protein